MSWAPTPGPSTSPGFSGRWRSPAGSPQREEALADLCRRSGPLPGRRVLVGCGPGTDLAGQPHRHRLLREPPGRLPAGLQELRLLEWLRECDSVVAVLARRDPHWPG